jgi:hypothetical protein
MTIRVPTVAPTSAWSQPLMTASVPIANEVGVPVLKFSSNGFLPP